MHPVLFRIGSYEVPAYGVALLIAFAVGLRVASWRCNRRGLRGEVAVDAALYSMATGIVGARLFYVVTHLAEFRGPGGWLEAFNPFHGTAYVGIVGLSMMGGIVLGVGSVFAYLTWKGLPVLRYLDVMIPSAALGEGITRIGCFLNGCCFGKLCPFPWGVRYPAESGPASILGEITLHPTQLYTSAWSFALFGLLVWLHRSPRPDGFILWWYLIGMSGMRILLDFVRWYEPEVIFFQVGGAGITVNQLVCAALIALAVGGLARVRGRAPATA